MARSPFRPAGLRITGSCPSGCWYSCDNSGRNCFCDCHDVVGRGLRGGLGMSEGTKKLAAVGFLLAAAMGGAVAGSAIKKRLVHRRY